MRLKWLWCLALTLPARAAYNCVPDIPPVAALISVGAPDAESGKSVVTGAPGAVRPGSSVILVTLETGNTNLVTAGPDGSFRAPLFAPPGTTVMVKAGSLWGTWKPEEPLSCFPGTFVLPGQPASALAVAGAGMVLPYPSQTMWTFEGAIGGNTYVPGAKDGRSLYVTCQGSATLSILDAAKLAVTASIPVDAEPYGVVAAPAGDVVYVAAAVAGVVDVVHISNGGPVPVLLLDGVIPVEARPKGLALSPDGTRLYVTHFFTGDVSVIDTASRRVVQTIATGLDSNMAQRIVLDSSGLKAYVPHMRSNAGNPFLLFDGIVFSELSVLDLTANQLLPAERADLSEGVRAVNLPSDVALSPNGGLAYVVNLGSGDLSVVDLKARYRIADVDVGEGPRGIVLSPGGETAYVLNSLSDDVSIVDLARLQETGRIKVTTSPLDPVVKRGKMLFFSSRTTQLSRQRWLSCASCHLEGDHDGRTWLLAGIGPRNTPSLRGAGNTAPLHWDSDSCSVSDVAEGTFRYIMGGSGLLNGPFSACAANPVRSPDMDALVAFVASLPLKPNPQPPEPAAVARGKAIFNRPDVGCAVCHPAPQYTDSTLKKPFLKHDVGTGDGPGEEIGGAFDTPCLLMLWNSEPYLHDGSAATLMDVLTARNPGDRHGRTSMLSDGEKADLVAFLLSL
jgi:YVTN family beta-propeller protein